MHGQNVILRIFVNTNDIGIKSSMCGIKAITSISKVIASVVKLVAEYWFCNKMYGQIILRITKKVIILESLNVLKYYLKAVANILNIYKTCAYHGIAFWR